MEDIKIGEQIPIHENNDGKITSIVVHDARISPISHHQTIEELLSELSRLQEQHIDQEFENYEHKYPFYTT